jgi:hypothetical protein
MRDFVAAAPGVDPIYSTLVFSYDLAFLFDWKYLLLLLVS